MEICKIAFFCEYQYLGFLKSQQMFSGALEFSFVFKSLLLRRKMPFLTKNYVFENFSKFPVEAEILIFQTKRVIFAPKQFAKFHTD